MTARIALILFLLVGAAAPALAAEGEAVTPDDLEAALQRNAEVSADLEATDVRYEAAIAEEIVLRESLHGLATRVTETEQELAILRLGAEDVVRESYMTAGSDGGVTTILGSTSFVDIPVRATYLRAANDRDLLVVDRIPDKGQQRPAIWTVGEEINSLRVDMGAETCRVEGYAHSSMGRLLTM